MNGTCQYNEGCRNPATTTFNFFGRDYRLCSTCEQALQPKIAALDRDAWKAADQATGLLAGHFGISIQQAAPFAQALVGQVASDTMKDLRQEAHQRTQPIPAPGPPPSADHPHPADWACDDLCRTILPAAPPRPQQAIPLGWSPPPRKTSTAASRVVRSAVIPASTESPASARQQSEKGWNRGVLTAVSMLIGLGLIAGGLGNAQYGSRSGLPLLFSGLALFLGPVIAWVIVFRRRASQRPKPLHRPIRPQYLVTQRKTVSYGELLAGMAAADLGLRYVNKRTNASNARAQAAKQQRRAEAESQQRQQELLDAIRQSSQPAPDPSATALGRSQLSEAGQRRRAAGGAHHSG